VAVINEAAGGNRELNDGLGPNALARFDRDVIAQSGVDSVIVFEGVNDIGTAEATPDAQNAVADGLIAAYQQFIVDADRVRSLLHECGYETSGRVLDGANELWLTGR
jgi:lysophospholipase L1-like esterase